MTGRVAGLLVCFAASFGGSILLSSAWPVVLLAIALAAGYLSELSTRDRLAAWLLAPLQRPVPSGSGKWEGVFSALHRFSKERMREREDLAAALARIRDAAEAMPDAVVILDRGRHIQWANGRANSLFGIDGTRDAGELIVSFIRQPEFVDYLEVSTRTEPLVMKAAPNGDLVLSIQLVPYGDEETLMMARDITELERISTVRRDFVANVSHELKTPLTVIAGFLETIEYLQPSRAEISRYVGLMGDQTASMQRLVNDLLALSAFESADAPAREESVDVSTLLHTLLEEAKTLSGASHDIALEIEQDAILTGTESELHSAFGNLISNAIRYTPAGGRIRISWTLRDDGQGVFTVFDSGIGIESHHIPRLTERFYRVDRGRSRASGGTGLGLAIVKHVLIRHDAMLHIESESGKGSAFSVRFPAARVTANIVSSVDQPAISR